MENILGSTVPPPPANVAAVEPDIRGATTLREQLVKHRNEESCAICHNKIDPLGFSLDSYDSNGRSIKPRAGKKPIDTFTLIIGWNHDHKNGGGAHQSLDWMCPLERIMMSQTARS